MSAKETFGSRLSPAVCGEIATTFPYRHEGTLLQLPGFLVHERIVWGLTHRMLSMLFTALG